MKTRQMTIALIALILVVLVLGFAWFDGGREEQRMIVEPVVVSEEQR